MLARGRAERVWARRVRLAEPKKMVSVRGSTTGLALAELATGVRPNKVP